LAKRKPRQPAKELAPETQAMIQRVSQLIEERGTHPREVARKANLGVTFVYDFLRGRNNRPAMEAMKAIAEVLGTTVAHLSGEADGHVKTAPEVIGVSAIPIMGIVEVGAYRKEKTQQGVTYGPSSSDHPTASHFALEVRDDCMNAAAVPKGSMVLCVDMKDAGLAVETGNIYAIRRTDDDGKTWEMLLRRARVFSDRTELEAESTSSYGKINHPGVLTTDPREKIYAFGFVYAVLRIFNKKPD
jgi:SOS-response transcriptional repressor LexA